MLRQHLLPASIKLTEWLGLIVRLPDTSVVLIQGVPVFKPPADDAPVEGLGIQHKVVDIGLLPFPQLGWTVST